MESPDGSGAARRSILKTEHRGHKGRPEEGVFLTTMANTGHGGSQHATDKGSEAEEAHGRTLKKLEIGMAQLSHNQARWPAATGAEHSGVLSSKMLVRLENTYKMEPDTPFNLRRSQEQLVQLLAGAVRNVTAYNSADCSTLAKSLANEAKHAVKQQYERFQVVATVTIVQNIGQTMQLGSRCLWNESTDCCTTAQFSNDHIIAVAAVFAIYRE